MTSMVHPPPQEPETRAAGSGLARGGRNKTKTPASIRGTRDSRANVHLAGRWTAALHSADRQGAEGRILSSSPTSPDAPQCMLRETPAHRGPQGPRPFPISRRRDFQASQPIHILRSQVHSQHHQFEIRTRSHQKNAAGIKRIVRSQLGAFLDEDSLVAMKNPAHSGSLEQPELVFISRALIGFPTAIRLPGGLENIFLRKGHEGGMRDQAFSADAPGGNFFFGDIDIECGGGDREELSRFLAGIEDFLNRLGLLPQGLHELSFYSAGSRMPGAVPGSRGEGFRLPNESNFMPLFL